EHMRELIERLAEQATVILSTHIMQEVDAICDRAMILRGGALVLDERLADLKESDRLRLRTDPAADLAATLRALPSITAVEAGDEGHYELTASGDLDAAAAAVAAALTGAAQPVYELAARRRDLETVFREVNAAPTKEVDHAA
ncbi:MAG: ABC transporter ATP-binding protein, partial [Pseudomonadota bacterium]